MLGILRQDFFDQLSSDFILFVQWFRWGATDLNLAGIFFIIASNVANLPGGYPSLSQPYYAIPVIVFY